MRRIFSVLLFLLSIQLFGVDQIFWGEGYIDLDNNEFGSVYRSNSDGTNRVKLFDTNKLSRKLKADTTNNKLYWIDGSGISRSNFDGSNIENIIPLTSSVYDASFGLDFVNGKIYYFFQDSTQMYIKKANLDGSSSETVAEFTDFSSLLFLVL